MSPGSGGRGGRPGAVPAGSARPDPAANLPKVLRIGIIQSGKIVEERIIRKRDTVTVGSSEKNTFVIAVSDLPSRFELFENKGETDYTLQFTESMGGRLSVDGEVQELEALRASGKAVRKGKLFQLKLNDQARGKIVVGDTTVLFQFVAPPPIQPRPQLPAAAKGGVFKNIEWLFAVIWIFVLFGETGFVTWLAVADWPKPTIHDQYLKLMELVEAPKMTLDQNKAEFDDGKGEGEEGKQGDEDQSKKQGKKGRSGANEGPQLSAEERAANRAALAGQLAQRGINKILGTLGGAGEGAIADVLRGGDVGGDQDELLSQVNGVGVATGGGGHGVLGGPAGGQGSGEAADISQLRMGGGDATVRTAGAGVEKRVTGLIKKKDPTAVDGTGELSPQEVAKVVNERIGAIKGCYERALRRNPSLEGKITIRFTIAGSGNVSSATATLNELTSEVAECVVSAFKRFRFPPPEGGSLTVEYPFLFTPSQ